MALASTATEKLTASPRNLPAAEGFPLPVNPPTRRLESLDLLRGLLMLLMALDHARDFFSSATVNANDPSQATVALFITRWITHLCAPGFIALAGASVYLQLERGKSRQQITKLLATRGLWLIFLELTVINFAWLFTWRFHFLQVIWAVGISMIALSLLQRLPVCAVGAIGAAILLLHNVLDPIDAARFGREANLWELIHQPGMLVYHGHPFAFVMYPVLAWIGVVCVGYAFGPLAIATPVVRRRVAATLGSLFLAIFAILRVARGYGDSNQWERLATPAQTTMSFFRVQKYPPSLEYVLATFGFLLLLYALFDLAASRNLLPRLRGFVEVFGRVPFFYYVLHIYLLHAAAFVYALARYGDWRIVIGLDFLFGARPPGWGFSLAGVYAIWIGAILILYLPCVWFSRLKARRRDWWLSYL